MGLSVNTVVKLSPVGMNELLREFEDSSIILNMFPCLVIIVLLAFQIRKKVIKRYTSGLVQVWKFNCGQAFIILAVIVGQYCVPVCQGITIQAGNSADFNCSVEILETSLWQRQRPDGSFQGIAQGGAVYSSLKGKFILPVVTYQSRNKTIYYQTLRLITANGADDGEYRCEEEGQIRTLTNLIVEIAPVLWLEINDTVLNSTTTVDVVSNQEIDIKCVAEGGKPPGKLSWEVNDEVQTGRSITETSTSERVTSFIPYKPTKGDLSLVCVSSGQQVIPEQKVSVQLNVQYAPNCLMGITNTTNAFVISCSCEANPEVTIYMIYVNDSVFKEGMQATLSSDKPAKVYCNATNTIGTYTTEPEDLIPFHEKVTVQHSVLVISLCIAAVLAVLVALGGVCACKAWNLHKQKKEAEERADKNQAVALEVAKELQKAKQPADAKRIPLMSQTEEMV